MSLDQIIKDIPLGSATIQVSCCDILLTRIENSFYKTAIEQNKIPTEAAYIVCLMMVKERPKQERYLKIKDAVVRMLLMPEEELISQ